MYSRTWGLPSSNCFAISIATQQNRDVTCMCALFFSVAISTQCNAFMVNKYPSYFSKLVNILIKVAYLVIYYNTLYETFIISKLGFKYVHWNIGCKSMCHVWIEKSWKSFVRMVFSKLRLNFWRKYLLYTQLFSSELCLATRHFPFSNFITFWQK